MKFETANQMDATAPLSASEEAFFGGAYQRIARFMLALGIVGAIALTLRLGSPAGLGFGLGAAVAGLNFYWLKTAVSGVADGVVDGGKPGSAAGLVLRFLGRYVLIAVFTYAIFSSPVINVYGFFAGLFLPVAAILCEGGYELYMSTRRQF